MRREDKIHPVTERIRCGIGGWSYAPWRENFFPPDLPQSRALEYASRQFSAIEINSTFYGTQKPATFEKWHDQTPDGFVFTVKGPRAVTHRTDLNDTAPALKRFIDSGLAQLGDKLGPLLWQFPPTRHFDQKIFDGFLRRLPESVKGRPLQHVLDVRHESFNSAEFIEMARRHDVAIAYTDAADAPQIADITAGVFYLRLREARAHLKSGYSPMALAEWVKSAMEWHTGVVPTSMAAICDALPPRRRNTYVFFINGAKERAPAAALKFQTLLDQKNSIGSS